MYIMIDVPIYIKFTTFNEYLVTTDIKYEKLTVTNNFGFKND